MYTSPSSPQGSCKEWCVISHQLQYPWLHPFSTFDNWKPTSDAHSLIIMEWGPLNNSLTLELGQEHLSDIVIFQKGILVPFPPVFPAYCIFSLSLPSNNLSGIKPLASSKLTTTVLCSTSPGKDYYLLMNESPFLSWQWNSEWVTWVN